MRAMSDKEPFVNRRHVEMKNGTKPQTELVPFFISVLDCLVSIKEFLVSNNV